MFENYILNTSTRPLTIFYTFSLGLVACLSISGQVMVQGMLSQQQKNLEVVSLIEERQTLCQEVIKFVVLLKLEPETRKNPQQLQKLQQLIVDWKDSGEKLAIATQKTPGFSQAQKVALQDKLAKMKPSVVEFREAAAKMVNESATFSGRRARLPGKSPITQLLAEEKILMQGLEDVSNWYTQETIAGVNRLKQVEYGLLGITLLVLLLEGILVFRPAVKKIEDTLGKLALEQAQSENLLLNILPQPIAQRLKLSQHTKKTKTNNIMIADGYNDATVMFADIVGFTNLSSRIPPHSLVNLLNQIFSRFDLIAESYKLEKIKTIGDAYMVVGGLPNPRKDHAAAIANMAIDMLDAIAQFNLDAGEEFQIRIGINSGAVVAGVIGIKKFTYDLWGDTVNIASRMESHGIPGRIHVTEATYKLLQNHFLFEERGLTSIKGKGEMQTYWLKGKKT
ncbi:MAG: adenylate/guanylate cyclase domain-containing protein [Nostocales cyanobacterium 94392]|nr:adenylate/guanylate cyclase domain-containing protein [Nostocales cyanobacterium 94392]